jgi:tetratricopeptide (TPR) repeat protein
LFDRATFVFVFLLSASNSTAQSDAQRVFLQVAPSVVTVYAMDENNRPEGQGSGVVIGAGRVVTNCHVIRDAHSLKVRSAKGEIVATWTTRDPSRDLCLLTVAGLDAPAGRIRPHKELAVGERVFAVGNPLGFDLSVSEGLVSALAPVRGEPTIITNAALSPGSSGGGLFDTQGRLVGITTAIMGFGQNLNLVIPAEWIDALSTRGIAAIPPPAAPSAEPRWSDEAEVLRAKSDWQALELYARKWLDAHPTSSEASYYLGVSVNQQGRSEEAESFLRSAIRNHERYATAWSYLAIVLHGRGKKEEALKSLDQAIEIRKGDAFFYLIRAGFMQKEMRHDDAKAAIELANAYRPGSSDQWFLLGQIETQRRQPQAAARAYRVALRLDPKHVQARQNLADVLARDGKTDQARDLLATEATSGAVAGTSEANTWLAVANTELQANRLTDAESAFRKAIALAPQSHFAWAGLGYVLARTGRASEAEESFLRALKIKPDYATAFWSLGQVQERRGDLPAALASYKNATEAEPANVAAWSSLASLSHSMRDFRQSTVAFQRMIDLGKARPQDYVALSDGLLRLGKRDAAREALQSAEKLAPEDAGVLLGISSHAGLTGDNQKALDYSERAIAKVPASDNAWSAKGYALLRLGRIPEAITALETAVGLAPKSVNALTNLGEAKVRNREFGAAILTLERAIELAPNALDARFFLAQAYFSVKQLSKAREHIEALLAKSPDFPQALALVTLTSVAEGKNDEALASFNLLKTKSPELAAIVRKQALSISPSANNLPE